MVKIAGVNSINYINKNKLESKISFKEGEKFSAKVCSVDKSTGEVTLKLNNGWEFKGHLKESMEFMEGKVLKFQVKDFTEGKLELGIVHQEENKEFQDSLKKILSSFNLEPSKENMALLEKMLRHDIPLTKDNIYIIKNMMDLKNKVLQSSEEKDKLINLILQKYNISEDSPKGEFIKTTLNDFLETIKNTDDDIILTLKENNIDISSKDNIDSMKTINKEYGVVVKDLKNILQALKGQLNEVDIESMEAKSDINSKVVESSTNSKNIIDTLKINGNIIDTIIEDNNYISKEFDGKLEDDVERLIKELNLVSNEDEVQVEEKNSSNKTGTTVTKDDTKESIREMIKEIDISNKGINNLKEEKTFSSSRLNELADILNKDDFIKDDIIKALNLEKEFNLPSGKLNKISLENINELEVSKEVKNLLINSLNVKEEIANKITELKRLIREVLSFDNKLEEVSSKMLSQELKSSFNNIKVLNSLTDNYYYLDTPLKMLNKEYPFKLIIKNNNKDKKQFDSKCIKIFASVKTVNMGVIDNYISINNKNMEVRIASCKDFMNIINKNKDTLVESLNLIGYLPTIIIDEKKEEVNISNSSDFFQDQNFSMINRLI